jgi:uncharacterized protein
VILLETNKAEDGLEAQGILKSKFEQAMKAGLPISRFENLGSILPPLSQQQRNIQWLESHSQDNLNFPRVEKRLQAEIQEQGLRAEAFEPGLQVLRKMLTNREFISMESLKVPPFREILERFLKREGEISIFASYLHIQPNFWTDSRTEDFLQELQKAVPGIQITGAKLVREELENLMAREAWQILLIALVGILALLYFDFRSWKLTLLSILPVVLASLWTLGFMSILKMNLNFMNLVVFTMVLGIGVDYGVHILHRGMESRENFATGLLQISKGVILAALTTLVGFGSLILSSYPGLQSMGAVALMGVGFSALISLTLIPVLLKIYLQKNKPS